MKRKYFLRGMGIGITITTLVFTFVFIFSGPSVMSEEEIIAEATRLGMTMSDSRPGNTIQDNITPKTDIEDTTEFDNSNGNTSVEILTGDDVIPTEDTTENEIGEEPRNDTDTSADTPGSANVVTFIISDGQDSLRVGSNLKAAGLVDDGAKFNKFLESNGYDRKLKSGTFKLRTGSSYKTLAEELTK